MFHVGIHETGEPSAKRLKQGNSQLGRLALWILIILHSFTDLILSNSIANVDTVKLYVQRSFANLKCMLEKMKKPKWVYFFIGPSGSGKTTTLIKLYVHCKESGMNVLFIDAKNNVASLLPTSLSNMIIFVDNAQCLRRKQDLVGVLLSTGFSYCLAFSPTTADGEGGSTHNCGFEYNEEVHFRPFSEVELAEFIGKRRDEGRAVSEGVLDEARQLNVLLPRLFNQCSERDEVTEWVHSQVNTFLEKFGHRVGSMNTGKKLTTMLMKVVSGLSLTESDRPIALQSGMFYKLNKTVVMVYPQAVVLQHLYSFVRQHFAIIRSYDVGASIEFLLVSQLRMHQNDVKCYGSKCSALHNRRETPSKISRENVYTIRVTNFEKQVSIGDALPRDRGCHLVKLVENHVAIDFVIIERESGKDTEKLFLIQASATKYAKRSGPKLPEVYNVCETLGDKSPLMFYSEKTGISTDKCYFVYASTADDKIKDDKVYFLKLNTAI